VRRTAVLAGRGMLVCSAAGAQKEPAQRLGTTLIFWDPTIRLWLGDAPQAKGKACEDTPTLTIFERNAERPTARGGGSFPAALMSTLPQPEGRQVPPGSPSAAFRAFVLSYRLSSNGYCCPFRCTDAQPRHPDRTGQGARLRDRPNRIVVIGFLGAGHLAALSGTQFVPGNPEADDPSSAPPAARLLGAGYPWIGAISSDTSHLSYCKIFNVMDQCEALRTALLAGLVRYKGHPPTFWYHTFNDRRFRRAGLRFY